MNQPIQMSLKQATEMAAACYGKKKYQQAETICKEILNRFPDHVKSLNLLALIACQSGQYKTGLNFVSRSLQANANWEQTHTIEGMLLRRQGKLNEAVKSYETAIRLNPDNPDAHNNLSLVLQKLDLTERSETHGRTAIGLAPNSAVFHFNLGNIMMRQDRPEDAIGCFQKALDLNPRFLKALQQMGHALLQTGKLRQAQDFLEEAVKLDPADATSNFNLSKVKTYESEDPAFIKLTSALEEGHYSKNDEIKVCFALGKMYDDIGDYGRAFRHFEEGNRLKLRRRVASGPERFSPERFTRFVSALIDTCTPAFFKRLEGAGNPTTVPVFIVGMPRSGTTLVEQILSSHSRVYGAGELLLLRSYMNRILKPEPSREFQGIVGEMRTETVRRLARHYLKQLPATPDGTMHITDKLPDNFNHLWLAALLFPNATVIHCQRDPMDTCLSCFTKNFTSTYEFTNDLEWLGRYYRDYRRLMQHWKAVLPFRILDVTYESVVTDLETEARRIVSHCGLEWDPQCLLFHKQRRMVQTASLAQVRQPIYSNAIGRWKLYADYLDPLRKSLEG